jgi:hypothetical protein
MKVETSYYERIITLSQRSQYSVCIISTIKFNDARLCIAALTRDRDVVSHFNLEEPSFLTLVWSLGNLDPIRTKVNIATLL